jgi:hypothetical protein
MFQDGNILCRVCDAFAISLLYPYVTMRGRKATREPRIGICYEQNN